MLHACGLTPICLLYNVDREAHIWGGSDIPYWHPDRLKDKIPDITKDKIILPVSPGGKDLAGGKPFINIVKHTGLVSSILDSADIVPTSGVATRFGCPIAACVA